MSEVNKYHENSGNCCMNPLDCMLYVNGIVVLCYKASRRLRLINTHHKNIFVRTHFNLFY